MNDLPPLSPRPLTPDDRPALARLVHGVDPADWVLDDLDALVAGPGCADGRGFAGFGAELPDGTLAAVCLLDFGRPGEAHLGAVRVAAELQDQGYGTRFLQAMLTLAARLGGRRVWLESAQENRRMHRVLEKLGFDRLGEWQVWVDPLLAPAPAGAPPVRQAGPHDGAIVERWLAQHPLVGAESVAAADFSAWDVVPVAPADLAAWLQAGELVTAGGEAAEGLMALSWGKDALRIRYLRGTPAAVGSLLAWAGAQRQTRPGAAFEIGLPGPQADLVRPWVTAAAHDFKAYAFVRTLSPGQ